MESGTLRLRKSLPASIFPDNFPEQARNTIGRLLHHASVIGVLYFYSGHLELNTVSESLAQVMSSKIPMTVNKVRQAVKEILWRNMKIVANLIKDSRDEYLVMTTAMINRINPIVDRLIDDESIEGVIMTNDEGAPIFSNIHSLNATTCGKRLKQLGYLCHAAVKELDVTDELFVVRIDTKNYEVMFAPNPEFNIIVIQHSRKSSKKKADNH